MTQDLAQEELPLVTFNSLYNLLRAEKKTKSLQKLPELFYEAIAQFLKEKQMHLDKETDSENIKKEEHIIKNSQKIIADLLEFRAKKIANLAIEMNFSNEELSNDIFLLKSEKEFFDKVVSAMGVLQ